MRLLFSLSRNTRCPGADSGDWCPPVDTPIPNNLNYPTIQDKDKEKDIKKEVKKEVQAEVTNDKIKFKIKDENESNEEDETGQLLVTDAEKPKDIKGITIAFLCWSRC